AIKAFGRQFMKSLAEGATYKAKYYDGRSATQKREHEKETRKMLEEYINRRGYKFISEEPARVFLDVLSKNLLFEGAGSSFNLVVTLNGHKVKSLPVDEVMGYLKPYIDQDAYDLSE